tara:strand:- start:3737 stop:4888 length:1152 start_codon:yes stop_codon:yes gene_type:complete
MYYFSQADKQWNEFLDSKILDYAANRNYDFGPEENSAVSKLSKFISHRILLEYQMIKDINSKYQGKKVSKFIEEVYWRIYWKGFLENKPCIWENFILKKIDNFDVDKYNQALRAETNISFFNTWVKELCEHNYLHNHTRMWFASTWIFVLELPWELGAKLFFKYLHDGDAASNLLSWRWVAGLHTKGKRYLFTAQNLKKFSNNRFNCREIENKDIVNKDEFDLILSEEIYECNMKKKSNILLMFENDLDKNTLSSIVNRYQKVYLILLNKKDRKIEISDSVYKFKTTLIENFSMEFSNIEIISSNSLNQKINGINNVDLIYPSIGDNYDFITRYGEINKITINNLVRPEDLFAWKYAKKGFFKFKENIPSINKFLDEPKILWK